MAAVRVMVASAWLETYSAAVPGCACLGPFLEGFRQKNKVAPEDMHFLNAATRAVVTDTSKPSELPLINGVLWLEAFLPQDHEVSKVAVALRRRFNTREVLSEAFGRFAVREQMSKVAFLRHIPCR